MSARYYPVAIRRQRRKRLAMQLSSRGVEVRVPDELDPADRQVQEFIAEGLRRLRKAKSLPDTAVRSGEDVYGRVERWAQQLDVHPGRVQVQPMRRKWASMSTRGNLTLARALLYLPLELVDYVIVHELLHLKFPNHRKGFQAVLDYTLPDWRQREEQLALYMGADGAGYATR